MNWQAFRLRALWCWHQLLTLALALVVVVAVMVGVSRQLLPMADHYRPQVEAALSQRLGLPVKLERLEGTADGVQLRLRLVQMELRDPALPAKVLLSIPEVELRPALWQMLRHGELRLDVRMRGLNIHLDQLPGGRLQLRELAGLARRGSGTAARTLDFALRQPALALSESRIGLALQNFPELSLGSVDIVNRNDGNHHRLRGRVQLPGVSEELAVQLDLDGDPLHWEQSRLRAWIRLPVMDWEPWLPALPSSGPGLRRLRGGGSYWLDFNSGRLVRLQARIDWRDVLLEGPQGHHRLRDVQGELAWQRSPQGWQLAGQGLQGVVDDLAWPLPQLALRKAGDKLTVALARSNLGNAGKLLGTLALALPLQGGGAPEVSIVAQLRDNLLLLPQARLAASDLRGEIRYSTAGGLQAERIEAQLLEAPVRAAIQTRRNEMVVSLAGTAGVPALRRWLGSSLLEVASGSTPYQARVILPAGESPRLQLDASLAGLRLNLPAPLGKAAKDAVPLRYQTSLGGREQRARLQYGQRLSGGLLWEGNRLDRALLRLDSRTPDWPRQPGLEIEGRLPRLDLGEWKPWLAHFRRPAAAATVAARGETPLPALTRLDLETRELVAEGWRLRNARVGLVRDPAAWRLFLDSDELNGRAQLPDDARKEIVVEFARLQWPLPTVAAAQAGAAGLNPVAGLGNRPLAVRGEGLRLAAWPNLGALAVSAHLLPMPYGLRVENIGLRSPMFDFDGRLDWQWRGGVYTRLRGKVGSANIAGLLAALGYAPSLVSRRAGADLDLTWRGAPDSPVLSALDGQLGITLEAGRLLNVSTGASVSRVFGWFDLDNLRRRFKGDFSDVLRRGLSFDRLSLTGPLQAGIMEPAVFQVAGATLNATGQGRLDLPQRQMDQHLTVTLPVSSAVPLAAVVVAGPVVGGAVAAAQKAFRKQLNQATQLHYRISGDWNDPAVQRLSTAAKPAPVDAVAREAE
ncbi:MAG: YhdP family protein [Pseudomonadota bacterium]